MDWSFNRNDGTVAGFQDGTERTWNAYLDWCTYNNASAFQKYITEGRQYANDLANASSGNQVSAKDNTNKNSIKVNYYVGSDNVSYIKVGPFNWQFPNKLDSVTLTGNNGTQPSLKIFKADGTTETNVAGIESGKDFYVAFRADSGITSITKLEGKGKNSSVSTINANIFFLEAVDSTSINPSYPGTAQRLILTETDTIQPSSYTITTSNIPLTISFSVIKTDDENNMKLPNVGFKFYNKESGKYLKYDGTSIQYVNTFEEATDFLTDENGKISLNNVLSGTYIAYETKNPNYGYVVDNSGKEFVPTNMQEILITNTFKYIRLSGLVWEDRGSSGKDTERNNLYRLDENDSADVLIEGIKVSLKDRTTGDLVDDTIDGLDSDQKVISETYTNSDGEYQFDYVPIENLGNYYIEFEYDGLVYENVIPHLENEEKGSKASEPEREDFNNRFNSMDKGSGDMQTIADQNGDTSERPIVNYDIAETGEGGRLLEMTSTENTEITATTDETGYKLEYTPGSGITEITNVNLGLYLRPQTDLALQTEIEEIKAEINGYGHIYRYGPKYDVNNAQEVEDSWNLGVRFENTYKGTYERPIYKADAAYENTEDPSKELRLSLTYKITIRNQGSVYGKVNKVIAYFDSRYDQITAIGTEMDNEGNVVGTPLTISQSQDEGNGYRRVEINTSVLNQIIDYPTANAEEREPEQNIYVQFNLPREVILEMLNEEEVDNTLSFTAEIGSYTSYSDPEGNTLYAAYDFDSVPDNATAGEFSTYEDDTDRASEVAITLAGARTISGYVFEDTKEESQENVAEGNGRKDDDETNLKGVTVELIDVTNDSVTQIYDSNTDVWANASYPVDESNGNYVIAGFIPGQYLIRFTWGDGTERIVEPENAEEITVENYKSTIISYDKYQAYQELQNQGNAGRFYKDETIVDGSSLALDNQEIRQQIDDDLKEYKYDTDSDITEIPADTWEMDFPIEYDADELLSATLEATTDAREDTNNENNEHRITFPVSNINFGIIRRPEQNIELTKTVTAFRFILPTGQTLIDATVNDDGTISGTTNYLSYIGNKQNPEGSVLRAEVDENLIQGSSVEIKYKLTVRNTSEVDYLNENYYNYGEEYYRVSGEARKTSEVVTFTPTSIIDYLDENSQFDNNSDINSTYNWTNITIEDANVAQEVKDALRGSQLDNYQLYVSRTFEEQSIILRPVFYVNGVQVDNSGNTASAEIEEGQPVASAQGANYQNQAEIIEVVKTGGGKLTSTPGNYIPNKTSEETPDTDDTTSEEVVIIPSTGGNRNYVLPISLMVIALITLGVGVYVIKVKVLGKK